MTVFFFFTVSHKGSISLLSEGVVKRSSAVAVFSLSVVVFSFTVVMPDRAVAVMPVAIEHKERAAGESLISESP